MPEPRVAFYGYLLTEGLAWVARRRVDGEAIRWLGAGWSGAISIRR